MKSQLITAMGCPTWLEERTQSQLLNSSEINHPNDFYGQASCIKRYAGYEHNQSIKTVLEHGLALDDNVWDRDLASPLPAMLVCSPYRVTHLAQRTSKHVIAIGPLIHYADPLPNAEAQPEESILVVFPAHSSADLTVYSTCILGSSILGSVDISQTNSIKSACYQAAINK